MRTSIDELRAATDGPPNTPESDTWRMELAAALLGVVTGLAIGLLLLL